jgi:hypothetical protein
METILWLCLAGVGLLFAVWFVVALCIAAGEADRRMERMRNDNKD